MDKKKLSASPLRSVLLYAKPYIGYLLFGLIFAVVSVSLTLYAPILTGRGIDLIIEKGNVDFDSLFPILVKLGIIAVIVAASQWLMSLFTNKVTYLTIRDIRNDAFKRLEHLPLKYIDSNPHGDILSRMINDMEQISDGLIMGFAQLFTGVVTIFGTLGFMLSVNVKITLIVVVITPLSLFVARFISKNTFLLFKDRSVTRGELTSIVEEMTGEQKTVAAFCHEQDAYEQFSDINERLRTVSAKAIFFSSLTNPCTRFVNGLVYSFVGIFGALAVISGTGFTVGSLSCFLTYANQYTKPFNEISGVITELQSAIASARRVFELIDEQEEVSDEGNAVLTDCNGNVSLDEVSFSYSPDNPLIDKLNLKVTQGQRIAIVGPTGCGKTTMINLLMRFYDVIGGSVSVDGQDIRTLTRSSLRSHYGMVLQETWLKSGTVFENIAYSKPGASRDEVIAAAKAAHADGFIRRLPEGYDTVVSDDGSNISQGQKQLLCIARVMLMVPPMLILDEATSSIDTMTEIRIQRAFAKLIKGRTSFIVAHRLSTIVGSDCILVMNKGHIIEQGTHEQLLDKKGFYYALYMSQFSTE
ncbi:MAG: ABC transporter ATP-binding protein/permease [Ruminococcus sp.]|nr:ABC transporter ATP-binding protein/permease [Ruminococcus sp.]